MIDNALFFDFKKISNLEILVDHFTKQSIFFSYFQVNGNYYLFCFSQSSIQSDFLYQFLSVIRELDSKERTIRSLRGFLLYVLDIIETGKDHQVLSTNLPPYFWRKVKKPLHKNQQGVLQQFLFGPESSSNLEIDLETKIQSLQNQIDSLQQILMGLKTRVENLEYALRGQNGGSEGAQIIRLGDSPSIQKKYLNQSNFILLGKLSEEEQVEIIQGGFQRNQEEKLSLKEYFEGIGKDTLFEWKGYRIKYESVRKTQLFQKLRST